MTCWYTSDHVNINNHLYHYFPYSLQNSKLYLLQTSAAAIVVFVVAIVGDDGGNLMIMTRRKGRRYTTKNNNQRIEALLDVKVIVRFRYVLCPHSRFLLL